MLSLVARKDAISSSLTQAGTSGYPECMEAPSATDYAQKLLAELDATKGYPVETYDKVLEAVLALERERHDHTVAHLKKLYPSLTSELKKGGLTTVSGQSLRDDILVRLPGAALNPRHRELKDSLRLMVDSVQQRAEQLEQGPGI